MRWRWAAWVAWCAAKPKNAPTRRMGARAVWSKAARRPSRCGAMRGGHALGAARSRECGDLTDLRTLRRAGDWAGCRRHPLSCQPLGEVEQGTLSLKTPQEEQ